MSTKIIKDTENRIGKRFGDGILTKSQYRKAAILRKQAAEEQSRLNECVNPFFKGHIIRKAKELLNIQKLINREMSLFEETHIDEPDLVLFIMENNG